MSIAIWKLLAGLAIFLFGMKQLERGIERVAGRTFKLFIRKYTNNPLQGVLIGIFVTVLLQSSSLVSIIVLAFVGAGVMSMRNALAVILGANFGTTLTSWLIALVGFGFDIQHFAFPILSIAGASLLLFGGDKKGYQYSRMLFGFGMLFLGLDYMKNSIAEYFVDFDITPYVGYPLIVFALIGFIITVIVQASSATMAIAMSAVYTGTISLEIAAGLVIGSEVGTSIKSWFGAINGTASKKQVALGNIMFNGGTTLIGLILIHPLLYLISESMNIKDPVSSLVLFQNLTNLITLFIFVPLIPLFTRILGKMFVREKASDTAFLSKVQTEIPEAAIAALEKESQLFVHRTIRLNLDAFHIHPDLVPTADWMKNFLQETEGKNFDYPKVYDRLKSSEGEILHYYLDLNKESLTENDSRRIQQLVNVIRNATFSAKAMKDIRDDRKTFRDSADDQRYMQYTVFKEKISDFYKRLNAVLESKDRAIVFNELSKLLDHIRAEYDANTKNIHNNASHHYFSEQDLSTLLNVNREIFSSHRSMLHAIKDLRLDALSASNFESLPSMKGN